MNARILIEPSTARKKRFYHSCISPQKLLNLDYGLFVSLCTVGTPSSKICYLLQLEWYEFEELKRLSGV
ncbi:MAG: hypothetical protein HRU20_08760 [Pseudomonadales bacterium]|nr:hypothetical protein [Pseudomonadales bacterium]